MKKSIVFILTLISFAACDLTKIEPAQTKAFMKYFGDTGNASGVDLLKLPDGYLILGNTILEDNSTVFLIHVDENGNTLSDPWTEQNFEGHAVTTDGSSYFIVGDRINPTDPAMTELGLIKIGTNLQGSPQEVNLGETAGIPYHGTALTIDSNGEIVVCGYTHGDGTENQSFVFGYDVNLTATWDTARYVPTALNGTNPPVVSGNRLYEKSSNNSYTWITLGNTGSGYVLRREGNPRDLSSPDDGLELLQESNVGSVMGSTTRTNNGFMQVQNILTPANEIALFNPATPALPSTIAISGESLIPNGVIQDAVTGEFVILATTTQNRDNIDTRDDTDFYVAKVGIDGIVSPSTGFTNIFGGTGSERGAAIVQADDGGYVILGTMLNTSGKELVVLAKLNSNGELKN